MAPRDGVKKKIVNVFVILFIRKVSDQAQEVREVGLADEPVGTNWADRCRLDQ
jgi:hypothetical protein